MKILILTPYAPYPPNSGGRMRMWEEIQFFGKRHDLTVVSFVHSREECLGRELLAGSCNRSIMVKHHKKILPTDVLDLMQLPPIFQWYKTPEMTKTLESLVPNSFDLVVIQHIFMAHYQELFSIPTILEEHNIESNIVKQLAQSDLHSPRKVQKEKVRTFQKAMWMLMVKYENETWPKFPLRITVSHNDQKELDSRCSIGKTRVIENGINTQAIRLVDYKDSKKILFMGTMDYYPNVDAVFYMRQEILPKIWERDPTISFVIAGRDPLPTVQDLAFDPRIEVIPNPDDMSEVAQKCCLTVVPLRMGSGTRIKILHSMAMGLPVVSTSLGSEGLPVKDGHHILIQDDPDNFSHAILQIIFDSDLRKHLRNSGRKFVEELYDWRYKFEQFEREMLTLINSTN